MSFEALLVVPPATDEGPWLTSEATARAAGAVVALLVAQGYTATSDQDEAEEGEMYDEVLVDVEGGTVDVALTTTGGFLSAEAEDERPASFWRSVLGVLAAVEQVTGAVPRPEDAATAAAGAARPE